MAGTSEYSDEISGSIKKKGVGGILDQLRTGELLKKDSAPWS